VNEGRAHEARHSHLVRRPSSLVLCLTWFLVLTSFALGWSERSEDDGRTKSGPGPNPKGSSSRFARPSGSSSSGFVSGFVSRFARPSLRGVFFVLIHLVLRLSCLASLDPHFVRTLRAVRTDETGDNAAAPGRSSVRPKRRPLGT
jgi:hypothetical protein